LRQQINKSTKAHFSFQEGGGRGAGGERKEERNKKRKEGKERS
jgi:hypothetical protein